MSSLKSVVDAVAAVAERSFFAFVEPAAADASMAASCYEMSVAFEGPFAGTVRVVMPVDLARELSAAFAGVDPGEPIEEDAVRDMAGEFANMACGAWLTTLDEATCFTLAKPSVHPVPGVAAGFGAVVLVNDRPVGVQLERAS